MGLVGLGVTGGDVGNEEGAGAGRFSETTDAAVEPG